MPTDERAHRIAAFCQRLADLDPGERARLKRAAGRPMSQSTETLGLFYRLLPAGVPEREEETWFMLATLYPLAEPSAGGGLGSSLARARNEQNGRGLDRRLETLLDSDGAQLPVRLRTALHMLQSQRVGVNWPLLLGDLLNWEHPDRFVQKDWARRYYAPNDKPKPEQ